jgi:hypothetical protein
VTHHQMNSLTDFLEVHILFSYLIAARAHCENEVKNEATGKRLF